MKLTLPRVMPRIASPLTSSLVARAALVALLPCLSIAQLSAAPMGAGAAPAGMDPAAPAAGPAAVPAAPSAAGPAAPGAESAFPPPPTASTMPTSMPANPVSAATAVPEVSSLKTATDAARAYASMVKAGAPRAAITEFIDLEAFAVRSFGDDYKKCTPVEQMEIRELMRSLLYLEFLPPQLPPILTTLTFGDFHEAVSPMADTVDIEYSVTSAQIHGKQKVTFQNVGGSWRIVDVWQGSVNISKALNQMWGQAKSQAPLLHFCRVIVVPRQMQQQQAPQGAEEGGPQGPAQGPAQGPSRGPAGPAMGPSSPAQPGQPAQPSGPDRPAMP